MNKGFTMVELLAAIVILSGIMLLAVPSYTDIAYSIKVSSLKNKTDAISSSVLKFAKIHLMDDIKPAGETCTNSLNCCKEYDLYKFIMDYGLYPADENTDAGGIIIDPLTNSKLNGCIRIKYNITKHDLEVEFVKDRILTTPTASCKG